MSMDVIEITRSVRTFFEVLSDAGGLSGILFGAAGAIHAIFNYNWSVNKIIENLYRPDMET